MNTSITSSIVQAKSNREQVTEICERLRADVESSRWSYKGGYTDLAMILSILDIAQLFGKLNLFWDARSGSYAAGITPTAASHSLIRLCQANRLIPYPHNNIPPINRIPKNTANAYLVNPDYPHVYRHAVPNVTFPFPVSGNTPLLSAGVGESVNVSTGEVHRNLIAILQDARHSYTHGDTRRALLIGRTELGVMLGKPAVRLCLKAGDQPRSIRELAGLAQVDPSTAGEVIRKKLAPKGLLTNVGGEWFELATHPGMGWWERGKWVQGIPLHEYNLRPGNNRVGRRLDRIARDRRKRQDELTVAEDRWVTAELARGGEKELTTCV